MSFKESLTFDDVLMVPKYSEILPREVNLQTQITMVLDDIGANAVKIGMLQNTNIIKCVYKILKKYKLKNIVLDPVMIAKGGARLVNVSSTKYLKKLLLPLCDVVTPNIPEAEILTGYSIVNKEDMIKAAKKNHKHGGKKCVIKRWPSKK